MIVGWEGGRGWGVAMEGATQLGFCAPPLVLAFLTKQERMCFSTEGGYEGGGTSSTMSTLSCVPFRRSGDA